MYKSLEELKEKKGIQYKEMYQSVGLTDKTLRTIRLMSDYQRMRLKVSTLLKIKLILNVDYITPLVKIINENMFALKKSKK